MGGAEKLTYEVARRLVSAGHSVEWFSARFPGAATEELLDGIQIVRSGRQWTVHWEAFRRYRKASSDDFDVIVDEVNTIPFLSPLWSRVPTVMFIHQLAREVWWYESRFPFSVMGFAAEPIYLRCYRRVPVVTVSASTRDDLLALGFEGAITIIPEGIDASDEVVYPKAVEPTFLCVGRIARSKRLEHAIEALARFRQATGVGTLRVVGGGSDEYQQDLVALAKRLGIQDSVVMYGRVDAHLKRRLMSESHALLVTSAREGWGLVVSEANACGTPAIVYDVSGLRDSVRHDVTGLVVPPRPSELAAAMVRLIQNPALYACLAEEARRWSGSLSFDETTHQLGRVLQDAAQRRA